MLTILLLLFLKTVLGDERLVEGTVKINVRNARSLMNDPLLHLATENQIVLKQLDGTYKMAYRHGDGFRAEIRGAAGGVKGVYSSQGEQGEDVLNPYISDESGYRLTNLSSLGLNLPALPYSLQPKAGQRKFPKEEEEIQKKEKVEEKMEEKEEVEEKMEEKEEVEEKEEKLKEKEEEEKEDTKEKEEEKKELNMGQNVRPNHQNRFEQVLLFPFGRLHEDISAIVVEPAVYKDGYLLRNTQYDRFPQEWEEKGGVYGALAPGIPGSQENI
ncbi:101 kDa malaria antigen [Eurytemora carolleeae]|uniref:101 kDa malaria antigen n=1 Tax=Eurytemora carolleeae TaxID=1294199 RepID=UPI000C763087|nr:101 kDa malaria antigen [Eurytemora carolleeae]|eukprot:XP_023332776.1 101 kDa malaria antigen-like [Eurytemora affinis]